ncbi:hypothetical protein ACGFXC_09080 [Streptomyces sp. NPDC048507]|uniref:hypothetical protein n=1 Tax=Streptomyces sp. NPDC048507 TaxID=3365560 RepID=UPI00371F8837
MTRRYPRHTEIWHITRRTCCACRQEHRLASNGLIAEHPADETSTCPGSGQPPRRQLTEAEHDAAWLATESAAGEDGAEPRTVLAAVLAVLGIDPPDVPLPGVPVTAEQLAAVEAVLPEGAVIAAEAIRAAEGAGA